MIRRKAQSPAGGLPYLPRPVWVPAHQSEDRSAISCQRSPLTLFLHMSGTPFSHRRSPGIRRNYYGGRYVRKSDVLGLPVLRRTSPEALARTFSCYSFSHTTDPSRRRTADRSERRWEPTLQSLDHELSQAPSSSTYPHIQHHIVTIHRRRRRSAPRQRRACEKSCGGMYTQFIPKERQLKQQMRLRYSDE